MNTEHLSEIHEEILESLWKAAENGRNSIADIRTQCAVTFTDNDIKELVEHELVKHENEILHLSDNGRRIAEKIVRRHRIAEVLITSVLKLKHAEMERIACEVEHSLQPEVEEAICTLLGHPEYCPDGKPIPKGVCCKKRIREISQTVMSLDKLNPNESGKVTYIKPANHSILEQLTSFGFTPGTIVTLIQKKPVYCVRFENTELALDREIVSDIYVWKLD